MSRKKRLIAELLERPTVKSDVSVTVPVLADKPVPVSEHDDVHVHVNVHVDEPVSVDDDGDKYVPENTGVDVCVDECVDECVDDYTHINEDVHSDGDVNIDESVSEDVHEDVDSDGNEITLGDINVFASTSVDVDLLKQLKNKNKKVKFEDNHVRRTIWMSKDVNDLLNIERKNGGNITKDISSALRLWFNLKSKGLVE